MVPLCSVGQAGSIDMHVDLLRSLLDLKSRELRSPEVKYLSSHHIWILQHFYESESDSSQDLPG